MPDNLDRMPLTDGRHLPPVVLLVDDDRPLIDTFASWLDAEGIGVKTAYDGLEALALVEQAPPDLVIADISMPGLDGISLASILLRRSIPVILISSSARPPMLLPGVPFVPKPFELDDVLHLIMATLSERRTGADAASPSRS